MKLLRNLVLAVLALAIGSSFIQAADLVITAANVKQVTGTPQQYTAGATITAGQCVYLEASSATVKLSKATAVATQNCLGIALNNASANQPVIILVSGQITIGATPAIGTPYVVSAANAGGIAPFADLVNPNQVNFIGYGLNATDLIIAIQNANVVHP